MRVLDGLVYLRYFADFIVFVLFWRMFVLRWWFMVGILVGILMCFDWLFVVVCLG